MKILITGINGQVGHALMQQLCDHELIGLTREECDLTQLDQIKLIIDHHRPNLIINPAAYTKVDQAEDEKDLAYQINRDAPRVMAEKAREYDIPFIHFSTDYVFDGGKKGTYKEDDPTNPLGVYGASKWAGEEAIQNVGKKFFIFRTSWVYSDIGHNFYLTMKRLSEKREKIKVVSDQFGVPTSNLFIAQQIKKMINQFTSENIGIYHLVPDGQSSWYEFAKQIITKTTSAFDINNILPVGTDQYPTNTQRPKNSVLDNSLIKTVFMLKFDDWKTELRKL